VKEKVEKITSCLVSYYYVATDGQSATWARCRALLNFFEWQFLSFFIILRQKDGSVICSAFMQRSKSRRTHNHMFSLIWDSPMLEGHVPIFLSPRYKMDQLYSQGIAFPTLSLSLSQKSEFKVILWLMISQSVCLGVKSTLGFVTRYYFLSQICALKVYVLSLCGAFSDESTGLQFSVKSLNDPSRSEPVTILHCLIWDSPNLKSQVPVFISLRNRVVQSKVKSRSHFTTDG
jgi:hypothetical protein